jgi:dolichol-phosphate mannosyltransferase
MNIDISIIVPIYNEEKSIGILLKNIISAIEGKYNYEIICIDDGSTDNTINILEELKQNNNKLKIISFKINYGKSIAYQYGFSKSSGKYIVTIDADLQDDPQEIQKMVNYIKKGFSLVVGWRVNRKDKFIKTIESKIWNYLINHLTGSKLHDINCGLKIFEKKALNSIKLHGDFHRYLPLIFFLHGFKVTEVKVNHNERIYGKSKYNNLRAIFAFFDFSTTIFLYKFNKKPMYFFGSIGGILLILGTIINFYLFIVKLMGYSIGNRPLLILGVMLFLSGIQLIVTGFTCDLIIRYSSNELNDEILLR